MSPSVAARPLFLAARAWPLSLRTFLAPSTSPSDSSSARFTSIIPAAVSSRSCLIFSIVLAKVLTSPQSLRSPRPASLLSRVPPPRAPQKPPVLPPPHRWPQPQRFPSQRFPLQQLPLLRLQRPPSHRPQHRRSPARRVRLRPLPRSGQPPRRRYRSRRPRPPAPLRPRTRPRSRPRPGPLARLQVLVWLLGRPLAPRWYPRPCLPAAPRRSPGSLRSPA